jgi:hypothetical protein
MTYIPIGRYDLLYLIFSTLLFSLPLYGRIFR